MGSSWHTRLLLGTQALHPPAKGASGCGAARTTARLSAFVLVLAAIAGRAQAQAATFALASGESKVQFVSDAPLERITGATTRVTGQIALDPAAPGRARAEIAVPVASIKTNNDLRDEHLRSDSWLDAQRFPNVEFTLSSVSGVSILPLDQSTSANVRGKLSVHGVTRELATTAKVRLSQTDGKRTLRVQATFPVSLEEHKVSIPSLVKLKVAPLIQVHLDLYAHAPVAATGEQRAAVPAAAAVDASGAQARPIAQATPSSKLTKPAAKSRLHADDAGARQHPRAAEETTRPLDARPAEPSDREDAGGAAAPDTPEPAPPSAAPSAPVAPSPAALGVEDAAPPPASREYGCNAVPGTRGTWPLLLSAAWLLRRRRTRAA
jgi:uncharacterized protein (TIGR03382 family)